MLAQAQALPQAAEVVALMTGAGVPLTASTAAQVLSAVDPQADLQNDGLDALLQVR